jgi:regulatory protein
MKKKQPRTPRKITQSYLHNAGLYYLERFAASEKHFKRVIRRKIKRSCAHHTEQNYEACLDMLETVAKRFVEVGLLNDELYTQGVVRALRRKGKSARFILGKLREKGIESDFARPYLEAEDNARADKSISADLAAAQTYARKKKLGPYARPLKPQDDPDKIYKRHLGALARAGFSYDVAKRVLAGDSAP